MKLILKTLVVFVMLAFITIKLTLFYAVELDPIYLAATIVCFGLAWLFIVLNLENV